MGEETEDAELNAPLGMMKGIICAIFVGFVFLLGILFSLGANSDKDLIKIMSTLNPNGSIIIHHLNVNHLKNYLSKGFDIIRQDSICYYDNTNIFHDVFRQRDSNHLHTASNLRFK